MFSTAHTLCARVRTREISVHAVLTDMMRAYVIVCVQVWVTGYITCVMCVVGITMTHNVAAAYVRHPTGHKSTLP